MIKQRNSLKNDWQMLSCQGTCQKLTKWWEDNQANIISLNGWSRLQDYTLQSGCIWVGLPPSNIRPRHSRVSCLTASWRTSSLRTRATETGNAQKFLQRANDDLCHSHRITQSWWKQSCLSTCSADSELDPLQWWEEHKGIGHCDGPFAQASLWSCVTGASHVPESDDRLVLLALNL